MVPVSTFYGLSATLRDFPSDPAVSFAKSRWNEELDDKDKL